MNRGDDMARNWFYRRWQTAAALAMGVLTLVGCSSTPQHPELPPATWEASYSTRYRIAPGDSVLVFVWRNPEVTRSVTVRPDGLISAPLLEEIPAAGKTPAELARDLEKELSTYLREPLVTVIVNGFRGLYKEQIRIVQESGGLGGSGGGEAVPKALLYNDSMTLLDVMIEAGGLNRYSDGNRAVLIRNVEGELKTFGLRLDDLLRDGDIGANVDMRPGDIVIIPEAWF
jgi:polysaccharide export outer membrane protein